MVALMFHTGFMKKNFLNIFSETRFFGYDPSTKEYNAEAHRDRIFGKHVADYMSELQDKDEAAYKRQFGKYITSGVSADGVLFF